MTREPGPARPDLAIDSGPYDITPAGRSPAQLLPNPGLGSDAAALDVAALDVAAFDDRHARAALSAVVEPGDQQIGRLVCAHGAPAVLAAIADGSLLVPSLRHYRTRLSLVSAAAELESALQRGIRFVSPADREWPSQLDDLGEARPLGLWVRGDDLRLAALRSVAVVGARACTAYGEGVAAEIAAVMAERGWTVVSGAAYGIDAAAHRGALTVGGATVAVLACGVDVSYPRGNDSLIARIAAEGVIVSELPPGATVTKTRFLERNRVIAALTRGTVVVEAAARSGSLSTAGRARTLSRHVMAVPGPVTSAASVGCHELVRLKGASLVTSGEQVIDLVGLLGLDAAPEARGEEREHDALSAPVLRVLEALPTRQYLGVESIVVRAGLDVPTVLLGLAELHTRGLAQTDERGWRLRRATGNRPGGEGTDRE